MEAKPLTVLAELLSHAGEVVSREALLAAAWPGLNVVPGSLATAISKLRGAFGDEGRRVIESVPRMGYRIGVPIVLAQPPKRARLAMTLIVGDAVPNRPQWRLSRPLGDRAQPDVWLAEHEKTGEARVFKFADTGSRLDALRREAAISRLLHDALGDRPQLVRITEWNFDARPFFIESQYGGLDLPAWAASRGGITSVELAERLAIVAEIAETVAEVHGLGVLHRDIKPSNILVSDQADGSRQIRLVDFGAGRLLGTAAMDAARITGLTLAGDEAAEAASRSGTLRYMAPEVMRGGPPSAAADVFALGVVLFQMIVGDLDRPLAVGWEADVADALLRADIAASASGDPSLRLPSAALLAGRLRSIDQRRVEAEERRRFDKERERLAQELEKVRAKRPWILGTFAGLVASLAIISIYYVQLRTSANVLASEVTTEQALTRFLKDDLIAAGDPTVSGRADLSVAEAARTATSKIDRAFSANNPELSAVLHTAMGATFNSLSDYGRALAEGNRAVDLLTIERKPSPAALADAQLVSAEALMDMGRLQEAGSRLNATEAALKQLRNVDATLVVRLATEKGLLAAGMLDIPGFLHHLQIASGLAAGISDLEPKLRDWVGLGMANAYRMSGRFPEADTVLRRLIRDQEGDYGADDARPIFSKMVLGIDLSYENRVPEGLTLISAAVPALERKLGPLARRTLSAKDSLAGVYFKQANYDEASRIWADLASSYARVGVPSEISHVAAQTNLARALMRGGHLAQSEDVFRAVLAELRTTVGVSAPGAQAVRFNLAYLLLELKQPAEVPDLIRGLSVDTLNEAQQESDWPGRLAFLEGRLALEQGDRKLAFARLTVAAHQITDEGVNSLISPTKISGLLSQASTNDELHP